MRGKPKPEHKVTHKVVVGRLQRWFEKMDMADIREEVKSYYWYVHPDVAYQSRETGFVFSCEVKPPYAKIPEIIKGIGQCALHPYHKLTLKPFLVISEKMYREIFPVFESLNWLGVIIYQGEGFRIAKDPKGQILYTPKRREKKRRGRKKETEEPLPDF